MRERRTPSRLKDVEDCVIMPSKLPRPKNLLKKPNSTAKKPTIQIRKNPVTVESITVCPVKLIIIDDSDSPSVSSATEGENTGTESASKPRSRQMNQRSSKYISESDSESDSSLLKYISTTITISQGRFPCLSDSSKIIRANLIGMFVDFLNVVLEKSKKKLGQKASMLATEDLTIKYNWWSEKEPKKIPQLFDLEDEEDFYGIC